MGKSQATETIRQCSHFPTYLHALDAIVGAARRANDVRLLRRSVQTLVFEAKHLSAELFFCQLPGTCTVDDFVAHLVALGLVDLGLEFEQDNMRDGSHFQRVEQRINLCR